jgi:hypothetical protein
MSLDAYVRCTCIRDGKVKKPHPFPDKFMWDESGAPSMSGDPDEEEWEAHDEWVRDSCEHEGFRISEFPGELEFFESMKRLCEASLATGNPIGF